MSLGSIVYFRLRILYFAPGYYFSVCLHVFNVLCLLVGVPLQGRFEFRQLRFVLRNIIFSFNETKELSRLRHITFWTEQNVVNFFFNVQNKLVAGRTEPGEHGYITIIFNVGPL